MGKKAVFLVGLSLLFSPLEARCDFWGGDVIVLTQILGNAIIQLNQLRQVVSTGADTIGLMRDINRGINDSLMLMRTVYPDLDPGLYSGWEKRDQALQALQTLYGIVYPSKEAQVQQDADKGVAEAVTLNNKIYKYTTEIDELGERIKSYSHDTSPGGAQKLTAETLGVMLHVMNQSLRTQATGLKLQAQAMAIQNHKDKEESKDFLENSNSLAGAMKADSLQFSIPRF